jgi:hypothetical protein
MKRKEAATAAPGTLISKRRKQLSDAELQRALGTSCNFLDDTNFSRDEYVRHESLMPTKASLQDEKFSEYKKGRAKQNLMWDLLRHGDCPSYPTAQALQGALQEEAKRIASKSPVKTRRAVLTDFNSSFAVSEEEWGLFKSSLAKVQSVASESTPSRPRPSVALAALSKPSAEAVSVVSATAVTEATSDNTSSPLYVIGLPMLAAMLVALLADLSGTYTRSFVVGAFKMAAYFIVLLCPSAVLLAKHPLFSGRISTLSQLVPWLLVAVTPFFLYFTWKFIIDWTIADFTRTGLTFDQWMSGTGSGENILVAAYKEVTSPAANWWWSAQLLMWVSSGSLFLAAESPRSAPVGAYAYACLGFFGAICAAFTLFYAQLLLNPRTSGSPLQASPRSAPGVFMHLIIISGLSAVVFLPRLTGFQYEVDLALVHLILATPAFLPRLSLSSDTLVSLYSITGALSLGGHSVNTWILFSRSSASMFNTAIAAYTSNLCQTSITNDVFFVTACTAVWVYSELNRLEKLRGRKLCSAPAALIAAAMVLVSPLIPLACSFPIFLAWRETQLRLESLRL